MLGGFVFGLYSFGMPSDNNSHPMFFYVYVLRSRHDGENYIGYTRGLRRRLEKHWDSKSFAT